MQTSWWVLAALAVLIGVIFYWFWFRAGNSRITVYAYGDAQENRILAELVHEFCRKNPAIFVALQSYPFPEFSRDVKNAVAQGTGPDVVVMEASHYSELVFYDFFEPLNQFLVKDRIDVNVFYPQVVDRFFRNGYLLAVPRDTAPICMVYYNKQAFDEAGIPYPNDKWDWDQFVETAKKVTKIGPAGKVERWGFVEGWAMVEGWVYNAGGSYADDIKHPTRWTLTEDRNSLKGLQFRWDLIHKHKVLPPMNVWSGINDSDSTEMFCAGKAAMILFGLWKTPRFREIKEFGWDAAMIPRDLAGNLDFGLGGSAYGIYEKSVNKKAAWRFIKYASGEEGARKLAADGLSQPARIHIANSDAFLDDKDPKNKKLVLDAMKRGKYSPLCKNWSETKAAIENALTPAWEGKISVKDALAQLAPYLEKNPPITK